MFAWIHDFGATIKENARLDPGLVLQIIDKWFQSKSIDLL